MQDREGNPLSEPGRQIDPWLLFAVGHLVIALACLIQWGRPSPWTRVDLFSGGYLVMRALPVVRWMLRPLRARISADGRRERWGSTDAPGWVGSGLVLTIADLAVYLDYGHWHLIPALQRPAAQAVGLLLHLAVLPWNKWAGGYLSAAFDNNVLRPALVRSGPFGYVRHPLYAGAMMQKIAAALVFGSAVGWLLVVLWWVLLLRQVRLEETHLRQLFGDEYEAYARQTAKLAPGIF